MFISPLLKKTLSLLPDSFHLPVPFGAMRGINWISRSANPGQVVGRYEPQQTAVLIDLLRDSKVFWDVGAHVGWYSLLASKIMLNGRVACFEPNPENLQFIDRHMSINNSGNINVYRLALSNLTGSRAFSGQAQFGQLVTTGEYTVETITADRFIETSEAIPDLIKVDIEGGEMDFLEGAAGLLTTHKPTLLLSTHGYLKRDSCSKFLAERGYHTELLVNNQQEGDYVFLARAANQ